MLIPLLQNNLLSPPGPSPTVFHAVALPPEYEAVTVPAEFESITIPSDFETITLEVE